MPGHLVEEFDLATRRLRIPDRERRKDKNRVPTSKPVAKRKERKIEKAREPREAALPDHEEVSRFPALDSSRT